MDKYITIFTSDLEIRHLLQRPEILLFGKAWKIQRIRIDQHLPTAIMTAELTLIPLRAKFKLRRKGPNQPG